eukprot:544103-Rhodomonas_salina.2
MHLHPILFIYLQLAVLLQLSGSQVQAACPDGSYCTASSNYAIDCALSLQCPADTDHVPEQIVVPAMIRTGYERAASVLSDNRVISWKSGVVQNSYQFDSADKKIADMCIFGASSIVVLFDDGTIHIYPDPPVYSSDTGGKLVSSISCGSDTTCVITTDSTLMCLGDQWNEPMLGLGDVTNRYAFEAVAVPAGKTVLQISLGQKHSCAILSDNQVYCWGRGDLPIKATSDISTIPNSPIPLGSATMIAHSVSVSEYSVCGIFSDPPNGIVNRVKCWGYYVYAYGTTAASTEPSTSLNYIDFGTVNQDGITPYEVLYVQNHCVLLHTHKVKCWGNGGANNRYEALGYENTNDYGMSPGTMGDNLPVIDFGTGVTVKQLAVNVRNSGTRCILTDDGKVKCWGDPNPVMDVVSSTQAIGDALGEMGDNLPYVDVGFNTISSDCACECTTNQAVWVDSQCQCPPGNQIIDNACVPCTSTCEDGEYWDSVCACIACPVDHWCMNGLKTACATLTTCAANEYASPCTTTADASCTPCPPYSTPSADITSCVCDDGTDTITSGPWYGESACSPLQCFAKNAVYGKRTSNPFKPWSYLRGAVLTENNELVFFGAEYEGEFGDGGGLSSSISYIDISVDMSKITGPTGRKIVDYCMGRRTTYLVLDDGTVWGAGSSAFGELGVITASDYSTPRQIPGFTEPVIKVECGEWNAFAITTSHTLLAWGRNDNGFMGVGDTSNKAVPTPVLIEK